MEATTKSFWKSTGEKFVSRKFVYALILFLIFTILFCLGKVSEAGYLQLSLGTFFGFVAGNSAEHVVGMIKAVKAK